MKSPMSLLAAASALALASLPVIVLPAGAQQRVTLTVITAGDQNMVDYVKDYLGPIFEKSNPNVTVKSVGTGPGDAGSQKIMEKLAAEKDQKTWDIDVAVIHQKAAGEMVRDGMLDMLNRGEIAMDPVWVDMFYTWKADGKLPPSVKLKLIGPGMPGQPMYYVIPAKAANSEAAKKFIELATSPAVQAEGIVKKFNWYPGIDANAVKASLDEASWNKLFVDV